MQLDLSNALNDLFLCADGEDFQHLDRIQKLRDGLLLADCPQMTDQDARHGDRLLKESTAKLNDAIHWQRFKCDHSGSFLGHWFGHDVHLIDDSILAQHSDEPSDYASCDIDTMNQQLIPSHRCRLEDGTTVTGLQKIFEGHSAPYKRAMLCGMLRLAQHYNAVARMNSVTFDAEARRRRYLPDEGIEEVTQGIPYTEPGEAQACG